MRANRLPASRGIAWIAGAFGVFRASPLRQLLYCLAFLFATTFAVALPKIGFALVWVLFPALLIGPHAVARAASQGVAPDMGTLLSGFRDGMVPQLQLGGFFLAAMLLVFAATIPADGGRFAQMMVGQTKLSIEELRDTELQYAMLIAAVLQTALLGALWYAPLLVAWQRVPVLKAAFFSAAAAFINWRAFLVFSIAFTLLFVAVLMVVLGAVMLVGGQRPAQANAAFFSVFWTLLPVGFAASYLGYREVFDDAPAPPA